MISGYDERRTEEILEEPKSETPRNECKIQDQNPLGSYTTSEKVFSDSRRQNRLLSPMLKILPYKGGISKLESLPYLPSPSAKFIRLANERDEFSQSILSSSTREQLNLPFLGNINLESLWNAFKVWIKNPLNMALFAWIICVAISGAILFLVMTGMLNHSLPKKSQRDVWFEVNNQILNALFTLMCLYQHPKRCHHLILLLRWKEKDIKRLRKIYCKNGTYKPHEWMHMMVVVILLHINCLAQYSLCGLNLGYKRSKRPPIGVGLCVAVAITAPAAAGLYGILSPLGKEYTQDFDPEAQDQVIDTEDLEKRSSLRTKSIEKRFSLVYRDGSKVIENKPEWRGGIFDLWDNISIAYLSLFCTFCVFGWNMERLGFGNMYVHIATFTLFCLAPFFIFNLAAINIDNENVRIALGITGTMLCIFGLLYGGFWRIQMRKRFNLPASKFCCGHPSTTDCVQWLCCCFCSLSQEVRTVDFYDIKEDKFYRKDAPSLLQCEDGLEPLYNSSPSSPFSTGRSPQRFVMPKTPSPSRFAPSSSPAIQLSIIQEEKNAVDVMTPPIPSSMSADVNFSKAMQ